MAELSRLPGRALLEQSHLRGSGCRARVDRPCPPAVPPTPTLPHKGGGEQTNAHVDSNGLHVLTSLVRRFPEVAMAETRYLIIEKYHVSQRWSVIPVQPDVLTPEVLVKGLRDGKYNLDATDFIIQDRTSGVTLANISLELEARSDISFHTD